MSLALPFLAIAGVMGLGYATSCRHCGGSLAVHDSEKRSVSEAMYERRFTEPALFLCDAVTAARIGARWEELQPLVKELRNDPARLSPGAISYGASKEYFSDQRAKRTGRSTKKAIAYAAEWQVRQILASEVVPTSLLVPCGKKGSLEEALLGARFDIEPELVAETGDVRLVIRDRRVLEQQVQQTQAKKKGSRIRRRGPPIEAQVWIFGTDKMGALFWPYGLAAVNLFTATSKMSAPSFSLPAGKPGEGGTCTAAGFEPRRGFVEGDEEGPGADPIYEAVCASCYALKGHYGYLSNIVPGLVRKAWVERHLRADPSGASLGEALTSAIESYARQAWLRDKRKRRSVELGVWDGQNLGVPVVSRGNLAYESIPPTSLDARTSAMIGLKAGVTTDQIRKRSRVPKGSVAGFFRIHDSGDFSVAGRTQSYALAWAHVAANLPHVTFWAPTRVYVFGKKDLPALQDAVSRAPDNLSIRPSAIYVNESPPMVPGLAAGTGVNTRSGDGYVDIATGPSDPVWQCPVYSKTITVGGKEREAKSCAEAGCRVCWLATSVPVAYGKH